MTPNTSTIIALLVTAQQSLYDEGKKLEATKLSKPIAAMLDYEVDNPSMVSTSGAGVNPTNIEGEAHLDETEPLPADSLAVRTAAASKRPLSKSEWARIRRQMHMHPPRQKRWMCCTHPEKRRTRKGTAVWGSVCKYLLKSGPDSGVMQAKWLVLSHDGNRRPTSITIGGHRMKFCSK